MSLASPLSTSNSPRSKKLTLDRGDRITVTRCSPAVTRHDVTHSVGQRLQVYMTRPEDVHV